MLVWGLENTSVKGTEIQQIQLFKWFALTGRKGRGSSWQREVHPGELSCREEAVLEESTPDPSDSLEP